MPHEDTRKIIKAGDTSFAIILPRSWIRFYKLKSGDSLKMISNGIITIEPPTPEAAAK